MSRVLPPTGLALVVLAAACSTPESMPVDAANQDSVGESQLYAPDRVIATHHDSFQTPRDSVELPGYNGLTMTLVRNLDGRNSLYELPDQIDPPSAVAALADTGEFESISLDYQRAALVPVNDPFFSKQWHLAKLRATVAWDYSIGANITVAVLDTGYAENNDRLNAVAPGGYDFINGDGDAADDNGHGTHVSGIIAQKSNNNIGVAGLAYGATILPIKVLDHQGIGYDSQIIDGINHAVASGAHVINMSLGGATYSAAMESAVNNAWAAGVFLACAAGNDGQGQATYPAFYDGCVGVGATNYGDGRAPYSNFGLGVAIAAPGGDLTVDANNDGYADGILQEANEGAPWGYLFRDGTSRSAPQVAAAAAMLMANGATNDEALGCLIQTAQALNNNVDLGAGLVRPDLALASYSASTCGQSSPPVCTVSGNACIANSDCCSGVCRGNGTCK